MNWTKTRVLVTGGCSFIGSHLVDALIARGATVRVADDLSSGTRENIQHHLDAGAVEFMEVDLLAPGAAERAVDGMQHVFHLAATHGGRGFIDLHQAACATNLALDGLMIRAAHRAKVEKFTFASSGCVYPEHLQHDPSEVLYLTEDLVKPPYDADNLYGWAKLMCELTLRAYHRDYGFKCASLRSFTAYGERCLENHAVIAMIARAFVKQDPFIVWGTGEQIRNWTYVSDIVEGTILAAEKIDDVAVQPYVDPNLFGRQRGHRVWLAKTLKATKSPEFWVGRPSYRRRAYGSCDRSSLDLCADSIVNSLWN